MKDNPDFECEWKAKRISNPEYNVVLEVKMIDDPEFVDDDSVYAFDEFGVIGFDLRYVWWHHLQLPASNYCSWWA